MGDEGGAHSRFGLNFPPYYEIIKISLWIYGPKAHQEFNTSDIVVALPCMLSRLVLLKVCFKLAREAIAALTLSGMHVWLA